MNDIAALAGRILLALIFLDSGIDKFRFYQGMVPYMTKVGLPFPEMLLILSGLVETICAAMIITGWKARWGALALVVWMIPVTLLFHNPTAGNEALIHFMKNLAITGGLLVLFASGPGLWSLGRSR
jgi:putative oxidoreductase